MKIALGSDHRGVSAVATLIEYLNASGHEPVVLGGCGDDSCDYPDKAWLVARAVSRGDADLGILVCGSGIGVSMAANKVVGVRAALVADAAAATASRAHNDANVLCLAGDRTDPARLVEITEAFLNGKFEGGRHERRVRKMAVIERGEDPAASTVSEHASSV